MTKLEAAAHWDRLATQEMSRVGDSNTSRETCEYRARIYRATAEALRIEAKTGVAVCSCHHKPLGTLRA